MKPKKIQTGKQWVDSVGNYVDAKRLFKEERVSERFGVKIYNQALKVFEALEELNALCLEGTNLYIVAAGKVESKDSATDIHEASTTFYSFDKSVKIEKLVQKLPEFDMVKLEEAKGLFEKWISDLEDPDKPKIGLLVNMVRAVFKTKSGKFDKKKLDQLINLEGSTDDADFNLAIELCKEARNNEVIKIYYNIYSKDDEGNYIQIPTRLSAITNINSKEE